MTEKELIAKVENYELDDKIAELIRARYEGYGQGRLMIRMTEDEEFYFDFDPVVMRGGVDESDIIYQVEYEGDCDYFDPKSWERVHDEDGFAAITRSDFYILNVGDFRDLRKITYTDIIDTFSTWLDDSMECFLNDERERIIRYIHGHYEDRADCDNE